MNRKILTIFIIAMVTFFPKISKADLDVIAIAQDMVTSATEKVNFIVKQYNTIQANLQELSLNRDIVSQIKDKVKSELKSRSLQFFGDITNKIEADSMMFLKSSLNSVSLPGLGKYIDMGSFVNPELTVEVGKSYLKKRHKKNDVQETIAQDERNNNLMVDNLAIAFANSLVHRKQIIDEDPCTCMDDGLKNCSEKKKLCEEKKEELNSLKDVSSIKEKYYETATTAHYRWFKIKEAMALYAKMKGEALMNQSSLDDVGAVTGVMEENTEESTAEQNDCDICNAENDVNRREGKALKSCSSVCD